MAPTPVFSRFAATLVVVAACLAGRAAAQPLGACPTGVSERSIPDALPDPVLPGEVFFDPFLFRADGRFYAYGSNWEHRNVQVAASCDLAHWTVLKAGLEADAPKRDALSRRPDWVQEDRDENVRPDLWAPEVIKAGSRYLMYFSARHRTLKQSSSLARECIGVATSSRPDRDFIPLDEPLVCPDDLPDGAIDPSPFRWQGRLYLLFKTDGNCCGHGSAIVAQRLSRGGLSVTGPRFPLIHNRAGGWEEDTVEAPTLVRHGKANILFYSGGHYGDHSYAVAFAACARPIGPCRRAGDNRILQSQPSADPPLLGPGHQTVLTVGGRTFLGFHALTVPPQSPNFPRELHVREIVWRGDTPVLRPAPNVRTTHPGLPGDRDWAPRGVAR